MTDIDVSHTLVSKITDRVLPLAKEWQKRALDSLYPIVFMDAIHYKVMTEGRIINRATYIAIGVNLEGIKEVLGIWLATMDICDKWTQKIRNWNQILAHLSIYFDERISYFNI